MHDEIRHSLIHSLKIHRYLDLVCHSGKGIWLKPDNQVTNAGIISGNNIRNLIQSDLKFPHNRFHHLIYL